MTNLKTLKDIPFEVTGPNKKEILIVNNIIELTISSIKAEAVKWAKEFQGKDWENVEGLADFGGSISKFIKHFFNLTEDDLK